MKRNHPIIGIALFTVRLILFLASSALSHAQFIAVGVPNAQRGSEGNSSDIYPFEATATGVRYQQVFDASEFSSIRNGGATILDVFFRLDGSCRGSTAVVDPLIQINLSTTSKAPDSLSPVFADNVGFDDTVVFGPGQLLLNGICSTATPQLFDSLIQFDHPFYYNPNPGNLLLDVRNYSANSGSIRLDAQDVTGDSVSRVYSVHVTDATAQFTDSGGLVTYIEMKPVPEPSTWALLALGLGGLALARTWRFTRRNHGAN